MIDDEDTKIRRNIVVVSAGILLAAYLELPAAWLFSATLPPGTPAIDQYKFWGIGFAILLYLGLRYKFSNEGTESIGSLTKEASLFRYDAMRRTLRLPENGLVGYAQAKKILPDLDALTSALLTSYGGNRVDFVSLEPNVHFDNIFSKSKTELYVTASLLFQSKTGPISRMTISPQQIIAWPKYIAFIRFSMPSHLRSWFYSGSAIRNLAPVALAILAEAVLMIRFGVAFMNT